MDNTKLIEAVGKLVKAKGRFHTEQNYKAVVEAYDAALAERAASNPASPALTPMTEARILEIAAEQDYGDEDPKCITRLARAFERELARGAASPAPVAAITDERAKFEKWITGIFMEAYGHAPSFEKADGSGNFYEDHRVSNAWEAWQARAALSSAPMAQAERSEWEKESAVLVNELRLAAEREKTLRDTTPMLLNPDELAALRRFNETCEDGEEYDVPKEMMRRLAEIGAVEWKGFSRYQITDFGMLALGCPPTPAVPAAPSEREAGKCKTCGGEGWVRDQHDMEQGLIRCTKCPAAPAAPIERENGQ